MRKKKKTLSITIDQKLSKIVDSKFSNKSKYIEWLISEDMTNKKEI